MRRTLGIVFVVSFLCGCGGPPPPTPEGSTPATTSGRRKIIGSARATNGNVVQVNSVERLSATEARVTVRIFNPGAVPISRNTKPVGPKQFYVAPTSTSQLPVPAVDLAKSALKEKIIESRENIDGVLYLKLPGPGPAELFYGENAELAVGLVIIPAEK